MTPTSRNIPSRPQASEDWFDFGFEDVHYTVNLSFMVSNYTCVYGRGMCSLRQGVHDTEYRTDIGGCCFQGVDLEPEEVEQMEERISRLTPDIVNPKTYERIQSTGGGLKWNTTKDGERVNVHTRVFDGGCIFANRANEGDKRGCSFHHLAEAEGTEHVDTMPFVCWAYPISVSKFDAHEHPYQEEKHYVISNMVYEAWGFEEEKGESDEFVQAICTEIPDMYIGDRMVYRSYEREIRARIGDGAYERMAEEIEKRIVGIAQIAPTRGEVRNDGRPLLPLIVGNRRDKYQF